MTSPAWTFAVGALIAAIVDWWAVLRGDLRTERVAKPAVMVALLGVIVTMESGVPAARGWVVVALVASLAGDVLLLPGGRFRAGLAAFLVAQLAYAGAFAHRPLEVIAAATGVVAAIVLYAVVGRRIVEGAARIDGSTAYAVVAYLAAISLMAVVATATLTPLVVLGAWSFVASDAVLGWTRFVGAVRGLEADAPLLRLGVIVPYHAAQVLIVLSFAM